MTDPQISTLCSAQIPSAASVLANAFAQAPRFRFLIPDDVRRAAKLRWYWQAVIRASIRSGGVVHVVRGDTGSAVKAVAIWETPEQCEHSALTLLRSGLWAAPIRLGLPAYLRRRTLGSLLSALDAPHPCWYLDTIGVEPSEQHRGLGSALLRVMLERFDKDTLPSFLDTSAPDNLAYYERFGFRVTAESKLPNGIPLWGMTRVPRP